MIATRTFAALRASWLAAGYPERLFVSILPDWWGPECEDSLSLLHEIEFVVARALKIPILKARRWATPKP